MEADVIERAKQAILDRVPEGYRMREEEARSYAQAVLEAVREPTDTVLKAGWDRASATDGAAPAHIAIEIWRAMIDAALGRYQPART